MEMMRRSGLSNSLKAFFSVFVPALPVCKKNKDAMEAVSANVSANLLGLGNAATPLGIQAASEMARLSGGAASDDLCMLVIINTASIQLIPAPSPPSGRRRRGETVRYTAGRLGCVNIRRGSWHHNGKTLKRLWRD